MKILINQFNALGDILFSIPIGKHFVKNGYEVIWYINDNFMEIAHHFPFIDFLPFSSNTEFDLNCDKPYQNDTMTYLPLRFANNILSKGDSLTCMSDKYKYVDLPLTLWKTLEWVVSTEKENALYYDVLGLSDGEPYNFVVDTFSSEYKIEIKTDNSYKNIVMCKKDGFTMLDWRKVIAMAKTIHTVGTSVNIIIEVINTKADEYHLYPRLPQELNCNFYNYLFSKPYIEHL